VDALQVKDLGAILSLVGLVSSWSRHHSSGRHSVVCFQRNPHKMCTRMNRCELSTHPQAGPCRNTHNLVEAVAPWVPPSRTRTLQPVIEIVSHEQCPLYPESGHQTVTSACLLTANSGREPFQQETLDAFER